MIVLNLCFCLEFCNAWPEGLETDEACDEHFPVEVITRDYLADSASVQDSRARVVTVTVSVNYDVNTYVHNIHSSSEPILSRPCLIANGCCFSLVAVQIRAGYK